MEVFLGGDTRGYREEKKHLGGIRIKICVKEKECIGDFSSTTGTQEREQGAMIRPKERCFNVFIKCRAGMCIWYLCHKLLYPANLMPIWTAENVLLFFSDSSLVSDLLTSLGNELRLEYFRGKGRPAGANVWQPHRHLWADCVLKMWQLRRLTKIWASTARYTDSFTFSISNWYTMRPHCIHYFTRNVDARASANSGG
jgi:hypothetical protein